MRTIADEQSRIITVSLAVLAAVATAFAIAYTRDVMIPFMLALFISYLVSPMVDSLQDRLRVPRFVGILVALLVALGVLTLLALLITTSTRGLLDSADIYREKLADAVAWVMSVLDRVGIDVGQQTLLDGLRELPLLQFASSTFGTVVDLAATAGLVLIFVIYLVSARRPAGLRTGIYAEIDSKVRRYLLTKIAVSATTGLLVGIILALFGLDLALVFGILAFLLNFIPSVGSIVATLLPLPIALVQYESVWPIIGVLVFPGVVQIVIGNGVEPKVMGEGLDLHPVTILLALIFWGLLWGIVGMLLAAPMTAVLRIVLVRIETTRPVAEILAGRLPGAVPASQTA